MDSQESPSVYQQEQEQSQPPRGHGTMASPPNPPPPQPYQQEQQQPPPHDHGEMEKNLNLPSSPSPPQRQNHQQEQTNSYMLPAKIIFHQPQQRQKRGRPKKSFDDGLSISPTLTSKAPGASSSEIPSEKSHGRLLRSRMKKQPQVLDSNASGEDFASSENSAKKLLKRPSFFGDKLKQEDLDSNASGDDFASSENPAKKLLKRPSFSVDELKQKDLGVFGSGWVQHLIAINIGEDIVHNVMTLIGQGPEPHIVRIISASGGVSDVTFRNFSTGGSTVTYEGQFVITSLLGSLLFSESKGILSITGDLSVSLSNPYNKVLSGVISGSLKAASPVQIVMGDFIPQKKKPMPKRPPNMSNMLLRAPQATQPMRMVVALSATSEGLLVILLNQCRVCQCTGAKQCESRYLQESRLFFLKRDIAAKVLDSLQQ